MNSFFLKLNAQDFIKGLVVAVGSSVITILYSTLESGSLSFDWKKIGVVALTSALGYLMKNFFTNQEGKLFSK
jgi:bacteriorhodopsin